MNEALVIATSAISGLGLGVIGTRAISGGRGKQWLWETMRWLKALTSRSSFAAASVASVDWGRNQEGQDSVTYFMKPLFKRPLVMLVRYPAGQMNAPHSHPVGHGMYVLQGSLVTNRGTFGPETFVWFPPGEMMTHGAGNEADLVLLLIALRGIRTDYPEHEPNAGSHAK
jgi:quercetin dioxygenase-like cupin family protein